MSKPPLEEFNRPRKRQITFVQIVGVSCSYKAVPGKRLLRFPLTGMLGSSGLLFGFIAGLVKLSTLLCRTVMG